MMSTSTTSSHQRQSPPETSVSSDMDLQSSTRQQQQQQQDKSLDSRRATVSSNGGDSNASYTTIDSDEGFGIKFEDWGFQVDRLFEVAYRFYKRYENRAFHPNYDERNQLIALILQARYGNFDGGKAPDVGALDLVGRSRRQYWATLKGMSKTEAMSKFIYTLNDLCPLFKVHVEAVKISCDVKMSADTDGTSAPRTTDNDKQTSIQINTVPPSSAKKDEKLKAIYTSLCRQTYQQFKGYAIKQYPDDVQQQKYLISSLQEQYYQQYISQMHPELKHASPNNTEHLKSSLSPAASETSSSIVHEDGFNNISIASAKTDQDLANDIDISTSNQMKRSNDQLDSVKQIDEPQLTSTTKDDPLVVLAKDDGAQRLPDVSKSQTDMSVARYESIAKTVEEQDRNLDSAPSQQPAPPSEASLPKPNPYQPVDLQSIGKFESFPKPKPIATSAHQMDATKEAPKADSKRPPKSPQPEFTAIDIGEESPSKEAPKPIDDLKTAPPVSFSLPPQELPPPPAQELPLPPNVPTTNLASPPPIEEHQVTSGSNPVPNDLNNQPEFGSPAVISDNKLPVELWGCDSSSGSGCDDDVDDLDQIAQPSVPNYSPVEPATIWSKRGCYEFRDSLADDKDGGAYVVNQGTLVIIQVPTYPNGRYIHWEFCTEDYDIGFGVDFVYEPNTLEPPAIQIFEETDDDEDDDCDDLLGQSQADAEAGGSGGKELTSNFLKQNRAAKLARLANTISIVPTYRRESHQEIFVGRHKYPGRGYYQLKFDNTYSVLRSKTIFFRICYFI